ncbi:MAG TPA: tetratricopeptide repeat protein [Thermoanaerobaculia bacterium]|nr:tetratricopeptide repeat protein [Thermoanaerobaculia bacterium]
MAYRGNPALPADTQRRIQGTFEQTLDLAEDGNRQEALLGCDFMLRMDPRFEPARRLQERLQDASGAVHVQDLRLGLDDAAPVPAAAADGPAEDPWGGLDLGELPELPPLDFNPRETVTLPAPAASPAGSQAAPPAAGHTVALRGELTALLERRAFGDLLTTGGREREAVADDPELFALVETAQSRLEAEPYVAKFLAGARAAREDGNDDEAERQLAKARSLDPTHPGLADLAERPAAPPPPKPQAVPFAADSLFSGDTGEFERRAVVAGESESDRRIADLLAEGQAAYDRGDYQNAIDAWSRIFLIDIDHQEAASRIEQARKLKAEGERQVEEVFHDGLSHLDAGDTAAARAAFERVLEMQPGHLTARELLQQIEAGKVPAARPAALSSSAVASPLRDGPAGATAAAELKEEILVPPEPGEARSGERRTLPAAAAPARPARGLRTFALVGGAVALLVLAGAWFLFQNRDRFFPNSAAEPAAAETDPIARATALHREGRAPFAIAQLRRLPPGDPRYKEAQELIRRWEAEAAPAAAAAPVLAPELAARREERLEAGRAALAGRDYLAAIAALEGAAAIQPLAPPEAGLLGQARAGLEPLAPELALFRQQDWQFVVPQLWRRREANPGDPSVNRLLIDSYYNLGVQALQGQDVTKAEEHFKEALQLAPGDGEARRHLELARAYRERAPDLLYRIYVKYVPFRG